MHKQAGSSACRPLQHTDTAGTAIASSVRPPTCSSSILRPPVTLWCGMQNATLSGRMGDSRTGAPGFGSMLVCACCTHESPQSHSRQPGAQE